MKIWGEKLNFNKHQNINLKMNQFFYFLQFKVSSETRLEFNGSLWPQTRKIVIVQAIILFQQPYCYAFKRLQSRQTQLASGSFGGSKGGSGDAHPL